MRHPTSCARHLQAGWGLISNNVLHDRSGFEDDPHAKAPALSCALSRSHPRYARLIHRSGRPAGAATQDFSPSWSAACTATRAGATRPPPCGCVCGQQVGLKCDLIDQPNVSDTFLWF